MNDDVKAAVEWARGTVESHDLYRGARDERDGSVENMRAILAHIDGEPARIAAACEETREACARRVPSIGQPHDCFEAVRATPLTATPLADALRLANETVVKLAQAATEAQARAEEGVRYWTDLAQAEARDAAALRARVAELEATNDAEWEQAAYLANDRAKKAEAEREALLARRCDAYSLLRPEFDGVTFCRKDGARAAQDVLAERDALKLEVESLARDMVAMTVTANAEVAAGLAIAAERDALRAQVEAARTYARQALDYGEDCDATDLLAAMDGAKP